MDGNNMVGSKPTIKEALQLTAEQTDMAHGVFAEFFEKNKGGIQYVDLIQKVYHIHRGWTVRGPIPRGVRIEMTGLANQRRVGKSKRRRG